VAIKEIILTYELLNKQYYNLLLSYLTTLTSINHSRLSVLWKNIIDLFLNLIESDNELVINFGIDYLIYITNFCFKTAIESGQPESDDHSVNLEQCIILINILINKKSLPIYTHVLRIIENVIDNNGYEISSKYWNMILDKIRLMIEFYSRNQMGEEVSKSSELTSLQHDSEDHCTLSLLFSRRKSLLIH